MLDQCRVAEGQLTSRAVLDVLGLAGSVQTQQMMRCILDRRTPDALLLLDQLYRSGKDVSALLGELSDLAREMTILKAAPEGGSALLSGLYDTKTLTGLSENISMQRLLYLTETLQGARAALPDSFQPRTDVELCLLRLCDESLCGDLTAQRSFMPVSQCVIGMCFQKPLDHCFVLLRCEGTGGVEHAPTGP